MNDVKRRKMLVVLVAAAAGTSVRVTQAARSLDIAESGSGLVARTRPAIAQSETSSVAEDPLLHSAVEWVERLRQHGQITLPYPVSRLQCEFLIGYRRTCALADALAQRGEWTIAFTNDGTMYAHIHRKV